MSQSTTFDDPRIAQLRKTARLAVHEHIIPYGSGREAAGTTPRFAHCALAAQGLSGLHHKAEDGGSALGAIASVVFAEEVSASSYGGAAEALLVHTDMSSIHTAQHGTTAQRRRYLPDATRDGAAFIQRCKLGAQERSAAR